MDDKNLARQTYRDALHTIALEVLHRTAIAVKLGTDGEAAARSAMEGAVMELGAELVSIATELAEEEVKDR